MGAEGRSGLSGGHTALIQLRRRHGFPGTVSVYCALLKWRSPLYPWRRPLRLRHEISQSGRGWRAPGELSRERGEDDELVDLKKLFEASFIFPPKKQDGKEEEDDKKRNYVKEPQVIRVILPNSFTCVCLNEHDIGA